MKEFQKSPDKLQNLFEEGSLLLKRGYRGRFAPSPTGPLHLGNLRTALISWLRARLEQGTWLLRIDDLDTPRNRSGAVSQILVDLSWLGLTWDGPIIFQSKRKKLYDLALLFLRNNQQLFACQCTRKIIKENQNYSNSNYIYPGTCRNLSLSFDNFGEMKKSWRLKVKKDFQKTCGDIILRRSDGFIAYHLATVIDDLSLGISEIVRGSDLMDGMLSQMAIIDAFKQKPPIYRHLPIILNDDGKKLSKREGGVGLNYLVDKGMNPSMVIGWMASSLNLVPEKSELSSLDLLRHLKASSCKLDLLLEGNTSNYKIN